MGLFVVLFIFVDMSSKLIKSWSHLVSGDKEQVQNSTPEPVKVLKRAPSKSIAK